MFRYASTGSFVLLLLLTGRQAAQADNWPAWRGPLGTGETRETDLPTEWSATENVRWKTKLPGRGNSSPIVWGNRVFITQADNNETRRTVMCFDRDDGRLLWQEGVEYTEEEPSHSSNPPCSPSPVTDGERVIAWFGSAGLLCYDFEGHELWRCDLGPQRSPWGHGSSPVLYGDLCFLNFGPGENEFVVAIDKHTGQEVWRADIPQPAEGEDTGEVGPENLDEAMKKRVSELRGSFSTPLVVRAGGREELIASLPNRVRAYDPSTGRVLWTCDGLGRLVYSSPMWGDGVLVAMGGWHSASLAVKPGGDGQVDDTHRLWRVERTKKSGIGSGLIYDGHVILPDSSGIVVCYDLKTGDMLWQKRLRAPGSSRGGTWSSLVKSGERIYLTNQSGDTFVFRAEPKFELLATNSIGEASNSSLAASDGELFIRTHDNLWCIGH